MLHEEKMIIAQHRIPDETTETTQVKELLEPVDLQDAVVTADAAHAQRETAGYIAGPEEDGGRESDYFLFVKGNQPGVQRAVFDLIQAAGRKAPDHVEIDYGHGRIIKRPSAGAVGVARLLSGSTHSCSTPRLRQSCGGFCLISLS